MTAETIIAKLIDEKLAKLGFLNQQIASKESRDISKVCDERQRIELVGELQGICTVKTKLERWFNLREITTNENEERRCDDGKNGQTEEEV